MAEIDFEIEMEVLSPGTVDDNISITTEAGLLNESDSENSNGLSVVSVSTTPIPSPSIAPLKVVTDSATLTPSHWHSTASETEIAALHKQSFDLRNQLLRFYEMESTNKNYINVLKNRIRNVDHLMEQIRRAEAENRRLKRDLAYDYDDSMDQKRTIEFMQSKLEIVSEEKEALVLECVELRRQRDRIEKELAEREKVISQAYRLKLEEELQKVEEYYKEENKKRELCSNCLYMLKPQNVAAPFQRPQVSLDSRVILVNPSHPSFDQIRAQTIANYRREPAPQSNTVRLDERVEYTYYAVPMTPLKPVTSASATSPASAPIPASASSPGRSGSTGTKHDRVIKFVGSQISKKRPHEDERQVGESLKKFRKVTIQRLEKS